MLCYCLLYTVIVVSFHRILHVKTCATPVSEFMVQTKVESALKAVLGYDKICTISTYSCILYTYVRGLHLPR